MDDVRDYAQKLRDDLLEQFKDKPNIGVFQKALARQLSELHGFFHGLGTLRSLQSAEGAQLDGIGDIVALSRGDALAVSEMANQTVPMDDVTYRLYLAWKIHLNTTSCTHTDIHRALKMFWDKTPIYYSENPAYPATMFFSLTQSASEADAEVFRIASKVKAAGVGLHFTLRDESCAVTDYSGVLLVGLTKEFYIEDVQVATEAAGYDAGAVYEYAKEVFTGNG